MVKRQNLWFTAAAFATLATAVSLVIIFRHLCSFTRPLLQRSIVRILLIIPIYSLSSFLSLRYETKAIYFDTLRDIYESYVIYMFLNLIIAFMGGESHCVSQLAGTGTMNHPIPCCCLPKITLGSRFIRRCKQGTLQFVIMKPVFALISLVLMAADHYEDKSYQSLLLVVYNISYTLALYSLLLVYMAVRSYISHNKPVQKFVAVKLIVFMTYYQALAVATIPGVEPETAAKWNNFILCIEMLFFAIMLAFAFPASEFKGETSVQLHRDRWVKPLKQVISVEDVKSDIKKSFSRRIANEEGQRGVPLMEMDHVSDAYNEL
jgi:hypothetical protein